MQVGGAIGAGAGSSQPARKMFGDEGIVVEMGVSVVHPGQLFGLAGAQAFVRVQAPCAGQQPLATKHLMTACDAAMEIVGHVEQAGRRESAR